MYCPLSAMGGLYQLKKFFLRFELKTLVNEEALLGLFFMYLKFVEPIRLVRGTQRVNILATCCVKRLYEGNMKD